MSRPRPAPPRRLTIIRLLVITAASISRPTALIAQGQTPPPPGSLAPLIRPSGVSSPSLSDTNRVRSSRDRAGPISDLTAIDLRVTTSDADPRNDPWKTARIAAIVLAAAVVLLGVFVLTVVRSD